MIMIQVSGKIKEEDSAWATSLFLTDVEGFSLGLAVTVLGLTNAGLLLFMSTNVQDIEVKVKTWLDSREIALVAVFSALTAILTGMTGLMLPTPTGGYTHIGDTAIYVAALLFGAKVGGRVGVIGPVAADLLVGYPDGS